ncbi:MAG: hypothetical protein AB8B64_25030 [Granulosicoccus sp.]
MKLNIRSKTAAFCSTTLSTTVLSLLLLAAAVVPEPVLAQDSDEPRAITACLTAFGDHPFGSNPRYRTLPVKVKVFGIGKDTVDDTITDSPELIYVRTGVNVAGGSVIHLNNPNGWYCMRTSVNVMGGMTISLACDARFTMLGSGATVMGNSDVDNAGTTVMGGTTIKRNCD